MPFLSQSFMHDWQVHSTCCKNSPYEQAKGFNDIQFYYFPSNLKKKNKTNKNLCVFKSFQYSLSIFYSSRLFSMLTLSMVVVMAFMMTTTKSASVGRQASSLVSFLGQSGGDMTAVGYYDTHSAQLQHSIGPCGILGKRLACSPGCPIISKRMACGPGSCRKRYQCNPDPRPLEVHEVIDYAGLNKADGGMYSTDHQPSGPGIQIMSWFDNWC